MTVKCGLDPLIVRTLSAGLLESIHRHTVRLVLIMLYLIFWMYNTLLMIDLHAIINHDFQGLDHISVWHLDD